MVWFVISIVFVVVGIVVLIVKGKFDPSDSDDLMVRRGMAAVGSSLILLGGVILAMDSFTVIPARNVGVVNTFGKAEGALKNGLHWVKPWSSIETVDATVQNINRDSDTKDCPTVRLQNKTTACVDLTLQWNIDQNANANELWQRYRGNNDDVVANVGKNVVERELRRALNKVFEDYNPLAQLQNGQAPAKTDDLAAKALADIRANVDRGIVIDTLLISLIHFDDTTQGKLNAFAQALADTQVATQQKLTNEQIKAANDLLNSASSDNPGVKYQNCLNLVRDLASKNQLQNLPPTFNCNETTGTPVIVGQK